MKELFIQNSTLSGSLKGNRFIYAGAGDVPQSKAGPEAYPPAQEQSVDTRLFKDKALNQEIKKDLKDTRNAADTHIRQQKVMQMKPMYVEGKVPKQKKVVQMDPIYIEGKAKGEKVTKKTPSPSLDASKKEARLNLPDVKNQSTERTPEQIANQKTIDNILKLKPELKDSMARWAKDAHATQNEQYLANFLKVIETKIVSNGSYSDELAAFNKKISHDRVPSSASEAYASGKRIRKTTN